MLPQLDISSNLIGGCYGDSGFISTPEGPKAIADALLVNGALTSLDVRGNDLDKKAKAVIRKASKRRKGFDLKM